MYERSYGYRYNETGDGWASAADIAKLIRRDIKQAVEEGLLPGDPVKYRVTSDSFSGGQSIDVRVQGFGQVYRDETDARSRRAYTPEAEAARMTLDRIHFAYNHDGSDAMTDHFDVRYYGHVEFEDPDTTAWRADQAAKIKARKAATDKGEVTGGVINVSRDRSGRQKRRVHVVVRTTEGNERLACGARVSRFGLWTAPVGTEVNCSRCAKRLPVIDRVPEKKEVAK